MLTPLAAGSRLPGIYCLWLSPTVVNVVTLHSAIRLKHHRLGTVSPEVRAIVSPQAAATWRGVVCLSRMAAAAWGMIQH